MTNSQLAASMSSSSQTSNYPALSVRYSRPCNVVAFSEAEPRLLATGLDKVRNDHCLAIWDVEQARNIADANLPANQSANSSTMGSSKGDTAVEATNLIRTSSTGGVMAGKFRTIEN
jgi:hypothetical protein